MGFKVNVAVNGAVVNSTEVDIASEHVFNVVTQVGGKSVGMGITRGEGELTVDLNTHAAGSVLVDDVLEAREQEKRERIEGQRREEEKPRRRRQATPRTRKSRKSVSIPTSTKRKVSTTARKKK